MSPLFLINFFDIFTNPVKFITDLIGEVVKSIVEGILNSLWHDIVLPLVNEFIVNPSNPINPVGVDLSTLFISFQYTAFGLLMVLFMIRILKSLRDNLTDEEETNYPELLGSFIVTCAFIFATPYVITEFLIPANTGIINLITSTKIGATDISVINKAKFSDVVHFSSSVNVWVQVILEIILFIVFILLTFAGAMRYVELILLYFLGPFFATSYINRSNLYPTYWTECFAVIFTQSLQFFLLKLAIALLPSGNVLTGDGIVHIVFMTAVVIVGIQGPQTLRQYIRGAGISNLASKAGKALVYRNLGKGSSSNK
ncbi:conjugal transfer protein TrbL family protein [Shimazuella kribbensis]|uniref:conjugal transfer protein TrbL family protein n=1 Tax=Shimazuella kribbensis TaxID=139808 RepID=UPI0003F7B0E5|nr:conjugal transfer protein TrbL family protein [Shimazuella kribbensis]